MVRNKKKLLILTLLALVLIGVGAAVAYFVVKSREKVTTMQSALDAYAKKDYAKAIELFTLLLSKDKDNEMAVTKLAESYCAREEWSESSLYWLQACRLNNLEPAYERNFVDMSLRGRFFSRVSGVYLDSRHKKLTLDEQLVLVYCLLMSGDLNDGVDFWRKINAENPEALEKPYGKLIKTTHFAADLTFEKVFSSLDELIASEDRNISQEAMIALANLNRRLRRYDDEEKNLKKVADLNFFVGTPLLGEFYSNHFKYLEAIDQFEKFLEKYSNSRVAMILGELLLFTSQHEKLGKLAADWKKKPGKGNIRAAYYIAAVHALAEHDFNAMATSFQPVRGVLNTPLAAFIAIVVDIHANDTSSLEFDLLQFQKIPPFFDLRTRVNTLVVLYLEDRIKAGTSAKDLLRLAEALQNAKLTEEPGPVPMLVSLIGKLQDNSLTNKELDMTMLKLPDDPTCLEVAISFHSSRGNMAEAKKYLEQLEKKNNGKLSHGIQKLAINILAAQGSIDEAAARLFALLEEDKSPESFATAFLFCYGNVRKDDLRKLAEKAGDDKALATVKQFCNSCVLMLDGEKDKALDMIEGIDTSDDGLLFFAGNELAANGRYSQALGKLSKIKQDYAGYIPTLGTMASIHLTMGDVAKAKEYAEQALKLAPNTAELKRILAFCFHSENDWQKAIDYSSPTLWEKNGDDNLRKIWIWAMEKNIASEFDAQRYVVTKRLCSELMRYDKENKVATEHLAKADEMIENQKKAEAE